VEQTTTSHPTRGRPRSERARLAILDAAADLLLTQGLAEVSMDAVAAQAGVSKATIYRWWRSKQLLVMDALFHEWQRHEGPGVDTGSLHGDLLSLLRAWSERARKRPFGHVIAAMVIEAHADPEFARIYKERFVARRRVPAHAAVERAIERGEIARDTDPETILDMLYGALYHRLLHRHEPLDDPFVERIVAIVVAGAR
jgi:AcrR family transcriptional regulator